MINSYKDLIVWQKSFALTKQKYNLTALLPKEELFGLVSQINRCAVSMPSNIAEGHQRNSTGEYKQFLGIAKGSIAELETQLLLVRDIYSLNTDAEMMLLQKVQKMLSTLIRRLTSNP